MAKFVKNGEATSTERLDGLNYTKATQQFDLSVIRPVKGKPGELVFEMTVTDTSVSNAVSYVKSLVGPEYVVLQTASVIRDKVVNPEQRAEILKRLGIYEPEGYDKPAALVVAHDEGVL